MTSITDEMLDRHTAQGSIAADQFRRGADHPDEDAAIRTVLKRSEKMARVDGVTDKALVGFLGMAALIGFQLHMEEGLR